MLAPYFFITLALVVITLIGVLLIQRVVRRVCVCKRRAEGFVACLQWANTCVSRRAESRGSCPENTGGC